MPLATLVPHVHPFVADGHPIYSIGARLPRTAAGRALWRWGNRRFVQGSLEEGRDQYNETRRRLGLEPLPFVHTALSRELTLVGTLPQLEYPRDWEPWVKVVGPLQWEPPGERVDPPPGQRAGRARRALDLAGPRALACSAPRWRVSPARRCA